MRIKKIEKISLEKPIPVYNLTVENESHNYLIRVGNKRICSKNCDELNEKDTNTALALMNSISSRFSSRFQGSDFILQNIVSSARTENSAMGEYIRHLPKDDPSILKLSPCLWEVKPDPNFIGDGTTFPVMVGNGSIPSKIITDPGELKAIEEGAFEIPKGCILINVPTVYRSKFELQLDQSIQDIAGMTTSDNNMVFRDTTQLEDLSLTPEMYLKVNIKEDVNILDLLPKNIFTQDINGKWSFVHAPKALRYGHVDLADGGEEGGHCDAAVCILHKEWKLNPITKQKDTVYVVDLLLAINAKNKVDIDAIQRFLTELVTRRNIPIHTISADQWQSRLFLQNLEKSGCFTNVTEVSVDKKTEPYENTARLTEQGLIKVGLCPKLRKELEGLVYERNKIVRTIELKDMADSLAGSIWNAQINYYDTPIYEYLVQNKPKELTYTDLITTDEYLTSL